MKTDFTKKPDTGSPEGRIELARMVLEIFDPWGLKVKEQLSLLGLSSRSRARLKQYLEGEAFANQLDLLDRAMLAPVKRCQKCRESFCSKRDENMGIP